MFRPLLTRGLALLFLLGLPAAWAVDEELPNESAANLSTLGRKPDWSELERYQATITHNEFVNLLDHVYATRGYNPELIKIEPDLVRIATTAGTSDYFVLHFAKDAADRLPIPHWWTAPGALPAAAAAGPLAGYHIALDPGHL
ncbi:MAG: hypothetical protein ABIR29_00270, partial [Chthoniobacterales bacterium]